MRILSFILTFVLVVAGPSMAGSAGNGAPGIGTFAYSGSPAMTSAPALVVASRSSRNVSSGEGATKQFSCR